MDRDQSSIGQAVDNVFGAARGDIEVMFRHGVRSTLLITFEGGRTMFAIKTSANLHPGDEWLLDYIQQHTARRYICVVADVQAQEWVISNLTSNGPHNLFD